MPAIFLCVFLLNKGQQRTCRLAIYNQSSIEHPIKSSTFFEALYLESANHPQLFLNDSTDYNGLLLINEKNDQLFATLYSTPQKINYREKKEFSPSYFRKVVLGAAFCFLCIPFL